MIRINLIPREERVRRRALPAVKLPSIGAAVPFVLLGGVVAGMVGVSALQQSEITRLETSIAAQRAEAEAYKPQLEKIRQITQTRQEVRNRLDIIAKLDQERYFRVKLMDELARSLPDNTWLTKVTETADHRIAVEGVTFSNLIVARFMRNLEAAPHWQGVDLAVAQQGRIQDYDVVQFSLVSGAQP